MKLETSLTRTVSNVFRYLDRSGVDQERDGQTARWPLAKYINTVRRVLKRTVLDKM